MKKLLYTTTAFVLCGGIVQANAACISTPSCYDMGYSSTSSCNGGLKCPFGSYWYCPEEIIKGGECAEFPYTCFGTGYVDGAGIGTDCNGKYVKCECDYGFEWKNGTGCVDITDCRIGSILYSDKSCSLSGNEEINGSKIPIGVVVYTDGNGGGQAMSLNSLDKEYTWNGYGTDISTLPNYTSKSAASKDYDSCGNTAIILAAGDKSKYPAAWAAHEYSTEGTSAGDWCLPAAGILYNFYININTLNPIFLRVGGSYLSSYPWSSSEYNSNYAWSLRNESINGGLYYQYSKDNDFVVRPVIEF